MNNNAIIMSSCYITPAAMVDDLAEKIDECSAD